jgi:hypothetical protein
MAEWDRRVFLTQRNFLKGSSGCVKMATKADADDLNHR